MIETYGYICYNILYMWFNSALKYILYSDKIERYKDLFQINKS